MSEATVFKPCAKASNFFGSLTQALLACSANIYFPSPAGSVDLALVETSDTQAGTQGAQIVNAMRVTNGHATAMIGVAFNGSAILTSGNFDFVVKPNDSVIMPIPNNASPANAAPYCTVTCSVSTAVPVAIEFGAFFNKG